MSQSRMVFVIITLRRRRRVYIIEQYGYLQTPDPNQWIFTDFLGVFSNCHIWMVLGLFSQTIWEFFQITLCRWVLSPFSQTFWEFLNLFVQNVMQLQCAQNSGQNLPKIVQWLFKIICDLFVTIIPKYPIV